MEIEQKFKEEYESFLNGNIYNFKKWLNKLIADDVILFIKWLQNNNLKI